MKQYLKITAKQYATLSEDFQNFNEELKKLIAKFLEKEINEYENDESIPKAIPEAIVHSLVYSIGSIIILFKMDTDSTIEILKKNLRNIIKEFK